MTTAGRKEINANIILYGAPHAGKTTNIKFIHKKLKPAQRGAIQTLSQEGYPHVGYEYLPILLGELKGYNTNLFIYTSPDGDDGLETRLNQLNEAGGVVFIVDSSPGKLDAALTSLANLKEELRYWNIDYATFPVIFQYNKRDVPGAYPISVLERKLNPEGKQAFEAIAIEGKGVKDSFAMVSKLAVRRVRSRLKESASPTAGASRSASSLVTSPGAHAHDAGGSSGGTSLSSPSRHEEAPTPGHMRANERENESHIHRGTDGGDERHSTSPNEEEVMVSATALDDADGQGSFERASPRGDGSGTVEGSDTAQGISDENSEEKAQSGEDFLKTEIGFAAEEPISLGTLEAGDVEDEADDDNDDAEPAPMPDLGPLKDDGPSVVSLPASPTLSAISLGDAGDHDVHIRTYDDEDDDEDDDGPVIHLRSAVIEEELQLDEEMLLEEVEEEPDTSSAADDGALIDLELSPVDEDDMRDRGSGPERAQAAEPAEGGTHPEPIPRRLEDSGTKGGSRSDTRAGESEEVEDWAQPTGLPMMTLPRAEETSAPAEQPEHVGAASSPSSTDVPPSGADASSASADSPLSHDGHPPASKTTSLDDDLEGAEDETLILPPGIPPGSSLEGLRLESKGQGNLSTKKLQEEDAAADGGSSPFEEAFVVSFPEEAKEGEESSEHSAAREVKPEAAAMDSSPDDAETRADSLPGLSISPLDDASVDAGPPSAPRHLDEEDTDEHALRKLAGALHAAPLDEDEEEIYDEGREEASAGFDREGADGANGVRVTEWGEARRLDDATLLLPVTIRLPQSDRTVTLDVKIQVDLAVEALLPRTTDAH